MFLYADCFGDHMATSKDCPIGKKEKKIQRAKARLLKTGWATWRFMERTNHLPSIDTYTAVSKPTRKTIDCQTELMWLSVEKPKAFSPAIWSTSSVQQTKPVVEPKLEAIKTTTKTRKIISNQLRAGSVPQLGDSSSFLQTLSCKPSWHVYKKH